MNDPRCERLPGFRAFLGATAIVMVLFALVSSITPPSPAAAKRRRRNVTPGPILGSVPLLLGRDRLPKRSSSGITGETGSGSG
jgi:hypothetical protein